MGNERRGRWQFYLVLSHVIVIGVVLLTAAAVVHAQGPPPPSTNAPTSILQEYKNLETSWIAKLLGAAQRLFFLLAGIEVAWSFTLLAIEKADFQALTATIVRKIMWIGIFYAILLYGVTPTGGGWIPAILNSFHILGQNASTVGPLGPSAIVGFGVNTGIDLLHAEAMLDLLQILATHGIGLLRHRNFHCISRYSDSIRGGDGGKLSRHRRRSDFSWIRRFAVDCGIRGAVHRLRRVCRHENPRSLSAYRRGNDALPRMGTNCAHNAVVLPDAARTGFDLAAAAVMFLCVCWMSPKISSAMLGGVASMSGGDLTGVGMGVGMAAVGAGVLATGYAARGSDALSKVKEAVSAGSRGSGGGSNGASGTPPRPGGGGNGGGPNSRSGGGSLAATQNGMPGGANQPAPPSRPPAARTSGQQPSPPRSAAAGANDSFLGALERTAARAHYAMNSVRIPHDGTSHAPPSSSTGHGDS